MLDPILNGFFTAIAIGSVFFGAAFALVSLAIAYERFVKNKDEDKEK